MDVVSGPAGWLERVWTAACDSPTEFSSLAKVNPGIAFARIAGRTTVHLRGPETKATTMSCPRDAEFFGAEFRLGAYVRIFPPAQLANLRDAVLPTLPDGRLLLGNVAWEMPTAHNVDVFIERVKRAGLLVFDPLVAELRYGAISGVPARTAQSRFVRAVGMSRRNLLVIERARHAAELLRAGTSIADVVRDAGYFDQPQLTREVRQLVGHTPAVLARGRPILGG